jgi:hypothetical protein
MTIPAGFERAYFRYLDTQDQALAWAWERVAIAVMEAPEEAWEMILCLIRKAQDSWRLEQVGAGPLESLLADHGDAFIDRVIEIARAEPKLRSALGFVWPHGGAIRDSTWRRIQALVSEK